MNIVLIAIFCVVSAIASFILKQTHTEFSAIIAIAAVCGVIGLISTQISSLFDFVESVFELSSSSGQYLKILIKSAGICFLSHFGSVICKECGQPTISQAIVIASKVSIILLSLPFFTELLKVASSLSQ